jgi:MFS transporter, DHA1 family, multidrug resistance protein
MADDKQQHHHPTTPTWGRTRSRSRHPARPRPGASTGAGVGAAAGAVAGAAPDTLTRFVAFLIDAVAVALIGLVPIIGGLAGIAYVLFRDGLDIEFMQRRSLGKKLMKLTVVRTDGLPMDPMTSARRNWPLVFGSLAQILVYIPVIGWILIPFVVIAGAVLVIIEIVRILTNPDGRRWATATPARRSSPRPSERNGTARAPRRVSRETPDATLPDALRAVGSGHAQRSLRTRRQRLAAGAGVLFVAQLLTAIGFSTIFPFLPNYVEHLGSATGAPILLMVTLVFSVQAFAMMLASPVWGALGDRFGRKRMVERAMYSGAVTILLMAFAGSAEELVGLRLLQGLTTGVMGASTSMVAAAVPRERIGYAMGLMQTALLSGVSVGPVIGGLLEFAFGYRAAFVVTAGLLLTGGLLVTTLVREHFVPPSREGRRPGLGGFVQGLGAVVRTPVVAPVFFVRFLAWTGRSMIIPFLPLLVAGLMAGANTAGLVTGLAIGASSAAGTVTSVLLGRLGDRVGHRRRAGVRRPHRARLRPAHVRVVAAGADRAVRLTGATIGGVLPTLSALLARVTDKTVVGRGLRPRQLRRRRGARPLADRRRRGRGARRRRRRRTVRERLRHGVPGRRGVLRARPGDAGVARAVGR